MALNINLFVHGVPMGQKIWAPKGEEQGYLSSFYGPKWTTPEVMKVDIKTFRGVTYCYYTFVKGQNVCDINGRVGSYLAITLRMNAFYSDVQNIYNILKTAYDKMLVGLCVQESDSTIKYLVPDFQSVNSELKGVEKRILNYIGDFSVDNDVIDFSELNCTSNGSCPNITLVECTKQVAIESAKKYGKLSVSAYFLSSSAAKIVAKYKAAMVATQETAKQKIQRQQQDSQIEIASIRNEAEEKLKACKEEAKRQLDQAAAENQNMIKQLNEKNTKLEQDKESLEGENKNLKNEISNWKKKSEGQEREIDKLRKAGKKAGNGREQTPCKVHGAGQQPHKTPTPMSEQSTNDLGQKVWDPNPVGHNKHKFFSKKTLICLIVAVVISLLTTLVAIVFSPSKGKTVGKKRHNTENVTKQRQPKCEIVITMSGKPVNEVECGKSDYKIELKDENAEIQEGQWDAPAFEIVSDNIMAKRNYAGRVCTIAYKTKNGQIIAKKSVEIKES